MIIWINGSFGVGKTTVAALLKDKIDKSIIYDPEDIGVFLLNKMPLKEDDFQNYQLWRTLNYEILKDLSTKFENIIVPMTITNKNYYEEIVGKLEKDGIDIKDFILIASKENIVKRLDKRGNSTDWAYNQVNRCVEELNNFRGYKIDTDNIDADKVVLQILNKIEVIK